MKKNTSKKILLTTIAIATMFMTSCGTEPETMIESETQATNETVVEDATVSSTIEEDVVEETAIETIAEEVQTTETESTEEVIEAVDAFAEELPVFEEEPEVVEEKSSDYLNKYCELPTEYTELEYKEFYTSDDYRGFYAYDDEWVQYQVYDNDERESFMEKIYKTYEYKTDYCRYELTITDSQIIYRTPSYEEVYDYYLTDVRFDMFNNVMIDGYIFYPDMTFNLMMFEILHADEEHYTIDLTSEFSGLYFTGSTIGADEAIDHEAMIETDLNILGAAIGAGTVVYTIPSYGFIDQYPYEVYYSGRIIDAKVENGRVYIMPDWYPGASVSYNGQHCDTDGRIIYNVFEYVSYGSGVRYTDKEFDSSIWTPPYGEWYPISDFINFDEFLITR